MGMIPLEEAPVATLVAVRKKHPPPRGGTAGAGGDPGDSDLSSDGDSDSAFRSAEIPTKK